MIHGSAVGNITADPEARFTKDNLQITSFTVACRAGQKDRVTKEYVTTFLRCTLFGKGGETFMKFHQKGSPAIVHGEVWREEWVSKDGEKKGINVCMAVKTWEFAPSKPRSASGDMDPSVADGEDSSDPLPYADVEDTPF